MNKSNTTSFAPQLYIPHGITDISFYERSFGAIELRRFSNVILTNLEGLFVYMGANLPGLA